MTSPYREADKKETVNVGRVILYIESKSGAEYKLILNGYWHYSNKRDDRYKIICSAEQCLDNFCLDFSQKGFAKISDNRIMPYHQLANISYKKEDFEAEETIYEKVPTAHSPKFT